jgi:hypothetical protein
VTYERLSEAFEKWKESQPINKPKDKDETTLKTATATTPKPAPERPAAITSPRRSGIISQILDYPVDQRTPIENIEFIISLKQQIVSIL